MLRPCDLKTENLTAPLGLETQAPRFSWRLESDAPGARQSAYRVRVDGLWDSGKVASDQCFDVAYAGPPLASRQRCAWTVEVWDERGDPGAPSPTAAFEMGLLSVDDWTAEWLAVETDEDRADRVAGLRSIWSDDTPGAAPRRFRRRFHLAQPATGATLFAGARDRLTSIFVDAAPLDLPTANPHAFGREGILKFELGALAAGEHVIAAEVTGAQNPRDPRPWRGAFAAMLRLTLADGSHERIVAGPEWLTCLSAGDNWAAPNDDDSGWGPATPAVGSIAQAWPPTPAMLLRSEFEVGVKLERARLYATALGAYEAFLNGARVGDALLAPESTDFRRRVLYQVYDVTELVRTGRNVLGAHVGDGWYASVVAPGGRYAFGPAPRRFLAQLELTFTDGSREIIATGPGWEAAPSPVVKSEIYNGETWDARLETPGWSTPGFDTTGWSMPQAADPPPGQLVAHVAQPIRVTETLRAKSVSEPAPGASVFDFGQNFAGLCRLRVRGRRGDTLRLRFAEILGADGQVDQANLRAAKATDIYILKGDPAGETFQPAFTYHGFRYVQVEGCRPTLDDLDGLVISSDLPITGALRIGHAGIEQLWRNTLWSQRSNFTGIPTDCPQRDERLGWLGDACVFWDAAAYNMDVYAFTQRFAGDMRDAQGASGGFSDFAPAARRASDQPAPGWADAGVVLPWTVWRRYGSTAIIDAHWDAMARYLRYIEDANPERLWANKRGLDFGDWLSLDGKQPGDPTTPKDLIGTAWWAHTTALAAEMAVASGRDADAAWLAGLRGDIVQAFQRTYVGADGAVGNGSQTGYILALKFGLVPQSLRAAAARRLTDEIEGRGGVLSTGFLGTPFSLDVLADIGRQDLVYDLLLRTEFPSWGYMIAKGATTIWERWNGDTGDVAMNSFNHYALGGACGFLFRRIAGIDAAAPGFREIRVAPVLDPRVRTAGADYDSVLGRISTDWTWAPGSRFDLAVTVPPNATARVVLPATLGRLAEGEALAQHNSAETVEFDLSPGRTQLTLRP
ncbi:MAG TPA: family 78 glycoside hydrolase catalytic domain [Caulobacteraceae bacterium]|nr:family 78 glycoside hydrolase catalytic domain [Caulobacteraceae bacterium]